MSRPTPYEEMMRLYKPQIDRLKALEKERQEILYKLLNELTDKMMSYADTTANLFKAAHEKEFHRLDEGRVELQRLSARKLAQGIKALSRLIVEGKI